MVETDGFRHIHLRVVDAERSARFYGSVFGAQEAYRVGALVFLHLPVGDVITLNSAPDGRELAGRMGGIEHFGLKLRSKADLDDAVREVEAAGGRVLQRGEHEPGHAYAYLADPDGYVFEL